MMNIIKLMVAKRQMKRRKWTLQKEADAQIKQIEEQIERMESALNKAIADQEKFGDLTGSREWRQEAIDKLQSEIATEQKVVNAFKVVRDGQ